MLARTYCANTYQISKKREKPIDGCYKRLIVGNNFMIIGDISCNGD
jgi:hypothetical protein